MKKLFFIFVFFLTALSMYAQYDREFWFVAPDITAGNTPVPPCNGGNRRYLNVSNPSTKYPTTVIITQPAYPAFDTLTIELPPNSNDKVELSEPGCNAEYAGFTSIENTPVNTINNFGILVQSERMIYCTYELFNQRNDDIFSLKGSNALGTEFYVPSQNVWSNSTAYTPTPKQSIEIVAIRDNTTINIDVTAQIEGGFGPGNIGPITLNRGQTYSIRANSVDFDKHLGGTHITASDLIAVTISDDSMEKGSFDDLAGDQLVPVSKVGTEYIITKGINTINEKAFIVATQNVTNVFLEGNPTTLGPINAGETYEVDITSKSFYIETSKPVYVYHISGESNEVGGALVPPLGCTGSHEISMTRPNVRPLYLNLLVPAGAQDNFKFRDEEGNVSDIPASWFEAVPGTGALVGQEGYKADDQWMTLKESKRDTFYQGSVATNDFYIQNNEVFTISNYERLFHASFINSSPNFSTNYAFFSNFGINRPYFEFNTDKGFGDDIQLWYGDTTLICYEDSINLWANGGHTYVWYRNGGSPVDFLDDQNIHDPYANPPTGIHRYSVNIQGDCNLDTTMCCIVIRKSAYVEANFTLDESVICSPDSLKIENVSIGANHLSSPYTWEFDTLVDSTIVDTTINDSIFWRNFNNANVDSFEFQIKLIAKNTDQCLDSLIKDIIIYPEVTADFDYEPAGIDSACNPFAIKVNNKSSGDTLVFNWEWGDQTSSSESHPGSHTYHNYGSADSTFYLSLIVTSPYNCRDTLTDTITVFPYLKAKLNVDKNVICAPDTVRVVNSSRGGITDTTITFNTTYGQLVNGTTLQDSIFYIAYSSSSFPDQTLPQTDEIMVVIENIHGCTDTAKRTILINPEITAGFIASSDTICSPATISFTDTSNTEAVDSDIYNWDFGDGGTSEEQSTSHVYTNNTNSEKIFKAVLTTTSNEDCVARDSINIVVNPFVNANFTVDQADSCADFYVMITNESTGDDENYLWDYDDGTDSTINTSHRYLFTSDSSEIVTRKLRLVVSNTEGCSDTLTRDITLYPKVSTIVSAIDSQNCHPFTVVFDDTATTSSNIASYLWDFGDGSSSSDQLPTHKYINFTSSDVIYYPTRTSVTTEGCTNIDTVPIMVYAYLEAKFTMDTAAGCSPLVVQHTNTSDGNISGGVQWTFGTQDTFTTVDAVYSYPNDTNIRVNRIYDVKLRVDNGRGCRDSVTQQITVYPVPDVDVDLVSAPPDSCQPLDINFQNLSDAVAEQYIWNFGDTTNRIVANTNPQSYTYHNITALQKTYTASLIGISEYYCRDTAQQQIVVHPYIKANFSIQDSASGCSPLRAGFKNNSKGQFNWGTFYYDDGEVDTIYSKTKNFKHRYPRNTSEPGVIQKYNAYMVSYNNYACSNTSATKEINVYPEVVANFSTDQIAACSPYKPIFNNYSSSHASYYFWTLGTEGRTSSDSIPNYTYVNPKRYDDTTYTITLDVWSEYFCHHDTSRNLTIDYKPYARITLNDDILNCSPYPAGIENSSIAGSAIRYYWDFGNGNSDTIVNDTYVPQQYYTNQTDSQINYQARLIAETGQRCRDTSIYLISVFPEVVASFTYNDAGCDPFVVQFNSDSSRNVDIIEWSFGDGKFLRADNPTFEYRNTIGTEDAQFVVTMTAQSKNKCENSTSKIVTVYASPDANFTVKPNLRIQYPDTTFSFINNSNEPSWTFEWDFGDGNTEIQPLKQFPHDYPNPKGGEYEVTLYAANPDHLQCTDSFNTILIVDPPQAKVNFYPHRYDSCAPFIVTFYDTSMFTLPDSNKWVFDDGSEVVIGRDTVQHKFEEAGTYFVKMETYDLGNNIVDSFIVITVYPNPEPDFEVDPNWLMLPNAKIYTHNYTPGGKAHSYIWDFGDGSRSSDFEPTHVYRESFSDTLQISLIAKTKYNCIDTAKSVENGWAYITPHNTVVFPNIFTLSEEYPQEVRSFKPCCSYIPPKSIDGEMPPAEKTDCDCGLIIMEYEFAVFNRLGERIYIEKSSRGKKNHPEWDGYIYQNGTKKTNKRAPQGVYVYKLFGRWTNGKQFIDAGDVTLIY